MSLTRADLATLITHSLAADLAYWTVYGKTVDEQTAGWKAIGYTLVERVINTDTMTHASIAESPTEVIVSIKGTTNLTNSLQDADAIRVDWRGHEVHRGALAAYNSIKDQVLSTLVKLTTSKPVRYIGHSAGAQIATLMAYDHQVTPMTWMSTATTFGSPRVGSLRFAEAYNALAKNTVTHRIVHHNDIVPTYPPGLYHHVTGEIQFRNDGSIVSPFTKWWLTLWRDIASDVRLESIREHYLSEYTASLENALSRLPEAS